MSIIRDTNFEDENEKRWRKERTEIEKEVKKMKMKDIRAEAEDLQHQNQWSGLYGKPMTRFTILKEEFFRRTGKHFRVPRRVYP